MMVKFHEALSERTVYQRYLQMLHLSQRIAHERLTRICFIDYARQMALVAEREVPGTGEKQIIAVGRLQGITGATDTTHWHAAHELAKEIPNAKLVVLPGEGHHYLATHPGASHRAIRKFIG